ncbi:glutamate racemase [Azospirillum sp. TSO22-1]|uniref:glutamate racemase n=1 Tax=Azospirillum sp. TSO22-1 TaxID=716789 RepID=UPI000D6146EB|nr:glutamate racemase [Azospirillum sp. TSO22-1]PWC43874.1 glutamate racemase [Azospirillum sp. TSO22-1]
MAIGVFDSGHGGLTVLRALTEAAPGRPFVYLGDNGNAPYGPRSDEEIYRLTVAGVEHLFAQGCGLIVVACNTAAAVALRRMQQTWLRDAYPGRNVLGVLVPMVEAITRVPWMVEAPLAGRLPEPRTVGVFATAGTVRSGSFPREIGKRAPDVTVVQQACPDLVPLIEEGAPDAAIRPAVRRYVAELTERLDGRPLDSVVLGCTHYPLVAHLFAEALPPGVEVLSQPALVARSLEHYLERHPEYAPAGGTAEGPRFFTTGDAARVSALAGRFFGRPTPFETLFETLGG